MKIRNMETTLTEARYILRLVDTVLGWLDEVEGDTDEFGRFIPADTTINRYRIARVFDQQTAVLSAIYDKAEAIAHYAKEVTDPAAGREDKPCVNG